MNENAMIGRVLSFRNRGEGDEYRKDEAAVIELVEVEASGAIELGFLYGADRVYLKVNAGELMQRVAAFAREE